LRRSLEQAFFVWSIRPRRLWQRLGYRPATLCKSLCSPTFARCCSLCLLARPNPSLVGRCHPSDIWIWIWIRRGGAVGSQRLGLLSHPFIWVRQRGHRIDGRVLSGGLRARTLLSCYGGNTRRCTRCPLIDPQRLDDGRRVAARGAVQEHLAFWPPLTSRDIHGDTYDAGLPTSTAVEGLAGASL
jgi:hypothetical protein